ncbi:hypothetical protein [Devosia salina]|uniref:DUF4142 domain-containing protein n=1 Tax=Devosia salina TaxID=2860336 RepID=A0ABX8WEK7_9HYPH|nr:hypothetical protein [Devosia salina]QYO76074.1 hypothetical protein K1X15_15835 [Devosia salina]
MKKSLISSVALSAALALVPNVAPVVAQESSQTELSASENQEQSQTWKNPERVAEIEDKDERIRAFSVLIGQSVYDEMLSAEAAQAMEGKSDSGDAGNADSSASSDEAAKSDDAVEPDAAMSSDSDENGMEAKSNAVSQGRTLNIVNIATLLDPADVVTLEQHAEQNQQELTSLQSVLELDEQVRKALEEEGVVPADVVGIQRTVDTLDILVIPDWLNQ